jgi:hypothetical protein
MSNVNTGVNVNDVLETKMKTSASQRGVANSEVRYCMVVGCLLSCVLPHLVSWTQSIHVQ